ncbi:hypothetical protein Scep_029933 [Stephania cephalantha]|uniref:Uncharacterized protein n=1 Tax=Stephania cephalantha TaxID=152367 RepID=A0AAP0E346_9MAGN
MEKNDAINMCNNDEQDERSVVDHQDGIVELDISVEQEAPTAKAVMDADIGSLARMPKVRGTTDEPLNSKKGYYNLNHEMTVKEFLA